MQSVKLTLNKNYNSLVITKNIHEPKKVLVFQIYESLLKTVKLILKGLALLREETYRKLLLV